MNVKSVQFMLVSFIWMIMSLMCEEGCSTDIALKIGSFMACIFFIQNMEK